MADSNMGMDKVGSTICFLQALFDPADSTVAGIRAVVDMASSQQEELPEVQPERHFEGLLVQRSLGLSDSSRTQKKLQQKHLELVEGA